MKVISALIWSEWRRQRKTALFILFTTIFFYALITMFVELKLFVHAIPVVSGVLVIGLPLLYALALGDAFASEFANKSNSFLLGLPISRTKIYFSKYLSSLSLFLPISIMGSLLMYTHNNFYKGASTKFITGMILFLLSVWLLAHVAIFLCNLITRNSNNGVIMLLILPILFIILAPGILVVNMFFFASDAYWFIVSIFSAVLTLYAIILILGWYLWNKRISRDLKCLEPIMKVLGIMFATSLFLYFLADMYTKYQYDSVWREVRKIKLMHINIYNSQLGNTADTANAMFDIIKFSEYIKKNTTSKLYLYKMLARRTHLNIWGKLWQKQNSKTKYMLNDINVQKIYSILEKGLNKRTIRYAKKIRGATFKMKVAIIFLIDLAITQARAGENKAFFKSLKVAVKYCVFLKTLQSPYDDSSARQLLRAVYYTILKLGPEGADYTDDYNEALRFIQNDKIYCPPYNFLAGFEYAAGLSNHKSMANYMNSIFYRLRVRQGLAGWGKYEIKRNTLYLEAEKTFSLKEVIGENKKLIKESKKIFGYCRMRVKGNGLGSYFLLRSKMTGDKICLALKIFRCRYGKYPEKLQDLCPEVLKEIPLVPINQKAYKYKKNKDGFILDSDVFKQRHYIWKYKMDYQPWEEKNK